MDVQVYRPVGEDGKEAVIYYLSIEFVVGDKKSAKACVQRLIEVYKRTEEQAKSLVKALSAAEEPGTLYRTTSNGNLILS